MEACRYYLMTYNKGRAVDESVWLASRHFNDALEEALEMSNTFHLEEHVEKVPRSTRVISGVWRASVCVVDGKIVEIYGRNTPLFFN